jgi:hypothetical protein
MGKSTQIENRNFLSPTGFKFLLQRSPKVAFFCNEANIPDLTLGVSIQPNYLKDIDTPGDKIISSNITSSLAIEFWLNTTNTSQMDVYSENGDYNCSGIPNNPNRINCSDIGHGSCSDADGCYFSNFN